MLDSAQVRWPGCRRARRRAGLVVARKQRIKCSVAMRQDTDGNLPLDLGKKGAFSLYFLA